MMSQDPSLLLVTDDAEVRERFERITSRMIPLETCTDADAAFAHLGTSPVSIVLLDTALAEPPPWQVAERLRREFPGTDLVLLGSDEPGGDEGEIREDCQRIVVAGGDVSKCKVEVSDRRWRTLDRLRLKADDQTRLVQTCRLGRRIQLILDVVQVEHWP